MVVLTVAWLRRIRRPLPLRSSPVLCLFISMSSISRLARLLAERSIKSGSFTLASGRRSDYYVDARLTTMCGEGQVLVGEVCWNALVEARWDPEFVGGLTLGADPVAYAIANHATRLGHTLDAFTVRKRAKGPRHGQPDRGRAAGRGPRVVVVDDTVTSGGSLLEAVRVVRDHGAVVAGVLALVDRDEGAPTASGRRGLRAALRVPRQRPLLRSVD